MGGIEKITFSIDKASKIHPVIFYCLYIFYSHQVADHPYFLSGIFVQPASRCFATERCFKHIEPAHCDWKTTEFNFIVSIFDLSLYKIRTVSYTHLTLPTNREV